MPTLQQLEDKVNMLQDVYETAMQEDDRWTANMCRIELEEINRELDRMEIHGKGTVI